MQKLSEYLLSMKLDDYSFELPQLRVDSATPSASVTLPFTYPHILTLLTSNSLLSMMIASLASVIQLSLTYPHIPHEAQMNNHQASYLVRIRLIFVFYTIVQKILIICYTVPEIWHMMDRIGIFQFGQFFSLLPL